MYFKVLSINNWDREEKKNLKKKFDKWKAENTKTEINLAVMINHFFFANLKFKSDRWLIS